MRESRFGSIKGGNMDKTFDVGRKAFDVGRKDNMIWIHDLRNPDEEGSTGDPAIVHVLPGQAQELIGALQAVLP